MDTSRETILKALCELVGRKDASVFQSAEVFERMLLKIGDWKQLPEVSALKAGLQERTPWELQKGSSGPVSRTLINSLATNIGRKHQINPALAAWAVESWAISLGLKIEAEAVRPAATGGSASSAQTVAGAKAAAAHAVNPEAWSVFEKNRTGIIFGTDAQGVIKVFKTWWRPAPEAETAGLAAVAVQRENSSAVGLFVAAPPPRRKKALPGQTKPAPEKTQSEGTATSDVNESAAQTKTKTDNRPAGIAPQVSATPSSKKQSPSLSPRSPAQPVAQPAAPVVLTGSAEELCTQAKNLLPGYGPRVDVPAALQMLQQAAKLGSIPARRIIGEIYHKGLGVKQDFATAANWFKLAADGGDAHAQFFLGTLYQCGMGVEFNLARAQEWLQKAANQGHKEAKSLLVEILQA